MADDTTDDETIDLNETGLVPTDQNVGKQIGKTLLKAAQVANRKALETQLVSSVQEIQVQLKKQRDYLLSTDRNIAHLTKQLEAIDAGEFTCSTYGKITFTDKALNNTKAIGMAECPNCGYNPAVRPRG